ncbi:MAG: tRNA (adenosine(37)-N6)-dimethylallyltransferase MiaA [Endozoicomonadaceae bacterium]|nr:tRNA (adenosine(37)-N6)-dimethylallyltransferase MiaA [Endozoicomonadaceae bacterium]
MGPTASGKTKLAMHLCDHFPCDIISVDSAQVYQGLDIGTAKISIQDQLKYPHHLLDICTPDQAYSVSLFKQDATRLIQASWEKQRIPLLVGGTMLYFHSLINDLSVLPPANEAIRNQINDMAQSDQGWQAVHDYLKTIDPISAARIHVNDKQRLQRAVEVYLISGQSLTVLQNNMNQLKPYHACNILLTPTNRSILHEQISHRCQYMFDHGFIEEVEQLYQTGLLNLSMPSMRAVGYRQVWAYLEGTLSHSHLLEKCIIATRQLAKRQLTWLRSWPKPHMYLDSFAKNWMFDALQHVEYWIKNFKMDQK